MSIPVMEAHSGAFRSIPVIIRTGKMMRTGFGAKHHGFNLTHLGMKKTPGIYVCTFSEYYVFD